MLSRSSGLRVLRFTTSPAPASNSLMYSFSLAYSKIPMDRSSSSSTSTSISVSAMASPRATTGRTTGAGGRPSSRNSLSWVRRVCSTSLRAAGIFHESTKPECHAPRNRSSLCRSAPPLIQLLLKPHRAQAQHRDPVHRQGRHLRPQHLHPRAFQEDAAHNLDEVPYRVQIRQVLHRHRHVADGKCEAREHERRRRKEKAPHHRLKSGANSRLEPGTRLHHTTP